ncbi:MAG: hypothetical protein WC002_04530 [Candidatus Muiribacteriota bacterium]
MKKKYIIELLNLLEEYSYSEPKKGELFLTLAHFSYLLKNNELFLKNLEKFLSLSKEKNIVELEKLTFYDNSFDIVLLEELYQFLKTAYQPINWPADFIEKGVDFCENLSSDYYVKPYFLCELLLNMNNCLNYELNRRILRLIITNYSNTKWEIFGLGQFSKNLEKIFIQNNFEDEGEKQQFLKEFREHLIFFIEKYPQDDTGKDFLFKLSDFFCENSLEDEAIKLFSRISDLFSDDYTRVRILYELGKIYHVKGNTDKTAEIYTELFSNFETRKETLELKYNAGFFLLENKFYKSSFMIFREIGEKFKNTSFAKLCSNRILEIGHIMFENKIYDDALFYFETVINLKNNRDDSSWALYYLAKIHEIFSEEKFSYDDRIASDIKSDEIYTRIVENYGDNKEILGKIDISYLVKNITPTSKGIDFNYIIFFSAAIIISIIIFLKFA